MSKEHDRFLGIERQSSTLLNKPLFVFLIVVGLGAAAIVVLNRGGPDFDQVRARSGRIGLQRDDGGDLIMVDRTTRPELWYRVLLDQVPMNGRLPLICEWVTPGGQVVHRNRYETRTIDNEPWETHARYQVTRDAPLGQWTVRLQLQNRVLHSKTFELREMVGQEEQQ